MLVGNWLKAIVLTAVSCTHPRFPQVFTITVPSEQESAARSLVLGMSPNARLTYSVGGTLKFELPTSEVSMTTD